MQFCEGIDEADLAHNVAWELHTTCATNPAVILVAPS